MKASRKGAKSQRALAMLVLLVAGGLVAVALAWNFPLDAAKQEALRRRIDAAICSGVKLTPARL